MRLLTTKLHPPALTKRFLSRPRLLESLTEVDEHKLTLLSAPTGYGKTSLVCEWITQADVQIAWFTVDEGDNNLDRFLTYISEALLGVLPEDGERLLAPLPFQGAESVELYLTSLINQIAAFDSAVLLILNDYESIKSSECHAAVEFLVEYAPENLSLLLMSRLDPPLPLSRWRAGGELLEIRTDALRFSFDEICDFFAKVVDVELSEEEAKLIETRTEGWAASLHLLSLSLHASSKERFFQALDESLSHTIDFLADEVLAQLPDETRRFLYQISILPRFTGSLCQAVTKNPHSENILRDLEYHNLFITHLDDDHQWYHFHPLFAACLTQRLAEEKNIQVTDLHQRAADWYVGTNNPEDALEHASKAQDIDRIAEIMEAYAILWIDQGEHPTFIRWFQKIPREKLLHYPSLTAFYLCALADGRNLNEFDSYADLQAELAGHPKVGEMIKAAQASACFLRGEHQEAIQRTDENISRLQLSPPTSIEGLFALSFNRIIQIGIYLAQDRLQDADKVLLAAIPTYLQTGLNGFAMDALGGRARNMMKMGQLHLAEDILGQGLLLLRRWGSESQGFPAAIRIYGPLSRLYYEKNRLEESITMAQKAIETARSGGYVWGWRVVEAYAMLGLARLALGEKKAALNALKNIQQFEELLVSYPISNMWTRQIALRQKIKLAALLAREDEKKYGQIKAWVYEYQAEGPERDEESSLIQAYLWIQENDREQAAALVGRLIQKAERERRHGDLIEHLLLLPSEQNLERALALAEKQGYCRSFVDGGQAVLALLDKINTPYAKNLLKIAATSPTVPEEELWLNLSERRILNLLAKEYTNQKIAYELNFSVNTVKWYARKIYEKLNVKNRREAVREAQKRGLV